MLKSFNVTRRFSISAGDSKLSERLKQIYKTCKEQCETISSEQRVNPRAVFVNNEVDLHKIGVYGFDYDYTLAVYTRQLNVLIYNLTLNNLVKDKKYPSELLSLPEDPGFAIRGLHFDINNSCLLKVDAYNQIQKGTVYRGRKQLKDEDVKNIYGGFSLSNNKGQAFPQLVDLFSLPWANLLATVIGYFDNQKIEFEPQGLYNDIASCVQNIHQSGQMYRAVMNDMETYIHKNVGLKEFLHRVVGNGKELFMVTNSPFPFMNAGMTFMFGDDWRQYFKYIVVSAKKPGFFQGNAPFRKYNEKGDSFSFGRVDGLKEGNIYSGGNIREFSAKASFRRPGVMYFGDHIYTDLAGPMLELGWSTAAVVPELAREIRAQNSESYRVQVLWFETLTQLIEQHQKYGKDDISVEQTIREWAEERKSLSLALKCMFNAQFGSMFRTFHNPTFFCRRLNRLSDIYTSRLPNLLQYDDDHTFFPRRNALAHEPHWTVPDVADVILDYASELKVDPKEGNQQVNLL